MKQTGDLFGRFPRASNAFFADGVPGTVASPPRLPGLRELTFAEITPDAYPV